MKNVIKYLQLPFQFSAETLVAELNALNGQWLLHYNKADYEGEWSALPLRSIDGSVFNIAPEAHGSQIFADTVFLKQCPYIRSVLAQIPGVQQSIRLLNLKPGAIVKSHRDRGLNFEKGEVRVHIPVTTNPQVEFYTDDERIVMKAGECWYVNFDLPHRLSNHGASDRVHIVMDIVVNEELTALFTGANLPVKKTIEVPDDYTVADKINIIEALRKQNTPAALRIAEEMQSGMS